MRSAISVFTDTILILLATLTAVILRDSFEFSSARLIALAPYFLSTTIASAFVLPLFGVSRAFWRFSGMPDYLRIVASLVVITVASVAITFAFNRVEGVPRSLPFLQFYLALTLLVGARVLYRMRYATRQSGRGMMPLKVADEAAAETVLLVGLNRLTETYLQSVAELAAKRIRIAGILGRRDRHVGRLVSEHKVLGTPEHLGHVLSELEVSGVAIDRIVVTVSRASLSREARDAIAAVQRSASVKVQYMFEALGFEPVALRQVSDGAETTGNPTDGRPVKFEIHADELETMQRRRYWKAKRAIDVVASLFLLAISSAVLILIGLSVAASMGRPLFFRQQRPGLGGRPFRVYKFRTMRTPIAADGRILSDEERVLRVGNFLRRTRLDELPQLFNILRGDMSFVGPRPLLPRDQDDAYRARLLVRPGLTGWAQVVGGRGISAEDKAALDVWYVRNASVLLDIAIVLRTVPVIFVGERTSAELIDRAWRDLGQAGILKGLVHVQAVRSSAS